MRNYTVVIIWRNAVEDGTWGGVRGNQGPMELVHKMIIIIKKEREKKR